MGGSRGGVDRRAGHAGRSWRSRWLKAAGDRLPGSAASGGTGGETPDPMCPPRLRGGGGRSRSRRRVPAATQLAAPALGAACAGGRQARPLREAARPQRDRGRGDGGGGASGGAASDGGG